MPRFSTDILIKMLRRQKGITQKDLSEGICTQDTLSRIERGERRPDWYIFEKLMQRLGEDPNKYYYDIITARDKHILDTKERLINLVRSKKFDEVEKAINELENDNDFQELVHLQFVIRMRATLAHAKNDYDNTYSYAIEALKITKPCFNEDEIDNYILFYDEIMLINLLSVAHFHNTSIEKSTDILLKLKASIDKGYVDKAEKSKTYLSILYNASKNLGLLKRDDECINICNEGLKYCVTYRNSYFHPLFLYNKTCSLLYLGAIEEGTKLFRKTCALFEGLERYSELDYVKNEIGKLFNLI